jgi:ParB family transcriptional regulator, chromosome partitioning protein
MTQALAKLLEITVEQLNPDPFQPRKTFLDDEIDRLAASMLARGVIQPLRVRFDASRDCYHIITGESRWRAAKRAGMKTLPCLVVTGELSETDILSDQIIENAVRNALKPLELARSLSKLKALKQCTAQQLAAELGISGASFSRAESLLSLPEDIQAMVDSGALTESAAYEISRIDDAGAQFELAHAAVGRRMNRDQVADAVRARLGGRQKRPKSSRLACKHEGISISVSAGQPLTLDSLLRAIDHLRKEAKKLIEAGEASKQPV